MSKKAIIISLSAASAVVLALISVIFIFNLTKKKLELDVDLNSSTVNSTVSSEPEIVPVSTDNGIYLVMNSPTKRIVNTTEPTFTFSGTSDPNEPLTMNYAPVERGENGIFSLTVDLKVGKNTFTFRHKEQTYVYTVNYRYVVIESYYPYLAQTYSSGSSFGVTVCARAGSSVAATFYGTTITLTPQEAPESINPDSEIFINYAGTFTLPAGNYQDIDCGRITFAATYKGKSESFTSGKITCKKPDFVVDYDPNATPLGGRYINVGSGKITEIIAYEAETFDAYSTNDWSRPTNNYLPKGTVDYSAQNYAYYTSSKGDVTKEYAILRCGYQVYTTKKDPPNEAPVTVVKEYQGILPDHNEIEVVSLENGTTHTTFKVKPSWKAPFYFDILPQAYTNPSKQDYTISNVTYNYIDITFCYDTVFNGELVLPENNPLFSSVKLIENHDNNGNIMDYTVRFYLKKQGAFYGWDANYDGDGNLVFTFLNPAKVTAAGNAYGADLTGVRILIDVGHGGKDCGATKFDTANHSEAIQNLFLAEKIKAQLESIGATVYMTRTSNVTSSTDDKLTYLKSLKPDFCIAIHHDSSSSDVAHGFGVYYSQPISKKAAELVYMHTYNTGVYDVNSKYNKLSWHYYFTARSSYCPVVLTENGFMSNINDYYSIIDNGKNDIKASAITKAIAEYFLSIQ